jgi:hypothetical protein
MTTGNTESTTGRLCIAILDRGWVFVGRVTEQPGSVSLTNADCIRRWGTERGIGQLALSGPTKTTKLDPAGTVTVPRTAIVALIDAVEASWPGR